MSAVWFIASLLSAMLFGASDYVGGIASRRASALSLAIAAYALSLPFVVILVLVAGEPMPPTAGVIASVLAGAVEIGGSVTLYMALAAGPIGIVAPVVALLAAGIPVAVGFLAGDSLGPAQAVGIGLGLLAIVLVARPSPGRAIARRTLIIAIVSGVLYAAAWLAFNGSQEAEEAVTWPILLIRGAGLVTAFAIAAVVRRGFLPPADMWWAVALLAVLDTGAAIALLIAFQTGPLGIVTVLTSLYPVVTVVLALWLARERPGRMELIGAGAALGAVALLAL